MTTLGRYQGMGGIRASIDAVRFRHWALQLATGALAVLAVGVGAVLVIAMSMGYWQDQPPALLRWGLVGAGAVAIAAAIGWYLVRTCMHRNNAAQTARLIERGGIEVAPLGFMRGRTLNDSFVILDEAQNTTSEQMKMFLTRLGFDSKAVITGDMTQIDLPKEKRSGLVEAVGILEGVDGIGFMRFTEEDVVRHPLVQSIIRAYDRLERNRSRPSHSPRTADVGQAAGAEASEE